jgi:hypothetical protein
VTVAIKASVWICVAVVMMTSFSSNLLIAVTLS